MTSFVIEDGPSPGSPPGPPVGVRGEVPIQVTSSAAAENGHRAVVAVAISGDCPLGLVVEPIQQIGIHLAVLERPRTCSACSAPWPCAVFDAAARTMQAAGLRVLDAVPFDLHPLLLDRTAPRWPS